MQHTFDFIRPKEDISPREILNTTLEDVTNLRSISSYAIKVNPDAPYELGVLHPQSYLKRYKSVKLDIETLREETRQLRILHATTRYDLATLTDEYINLNNKYKNLQHDHNLLNDNFQELMNELSVHREAGQEMIDWESRSRIAQGLNDEWVPLVAPDYSLLKDGGFNYLPHILSVLAVKTNRDPAPRLLKTINQKELDRLLRRADSLDQKGLGIIAERVWHTIPALQRNTMVTMYLTTRTHPRTLVAHPLPTSDQGRVVIELDSHLSTEEKEVAYYNCC